VVAVGGSGGGAGARPAPPQPRRARRSRRWLPRGPGTQPAGRRQQPHAARLDPLAPSPHRPPSQIAKLLIIPFVAVMEMVWFNKRFTPPVAASMVVVVIGVSIV
jgi:hypothetical protein